MPGIEWSDTEKVISVYFASHGVHHNVIVKLLHLRGFNRTVHGVDNQMVVLRKKNPELGSPGLWNIEGVNQWLFEHLGNLGEDIPTLDDFSVIQQHQPDYDTIPGLYGSESYGASFKCPA